MKVEFINDKSIEASYGLGGRAIFTPLYMVIGKSKYFVKNSVKPRIGDDSARMEIDSERSVEETNKAKKQLLANEGKYFAFHSKKENLLDFLKWIKEEKYTLQIQGELFNTIFENDGSKPFTDFSGGLLEYSATFKYRIYDEELLLAVQEIVKLLPQCYAWKRKE